MSNYCSQVIVVLVVLAVSFALSSTCIFYGYSCISAELRANHTDYCKDIHNDASAWALACFGMLFSLPWIIVVFAPFLFLSKMFRSWAVERFGAVCYNRTLLVLAFLGVVSSGLGAVCLICGKEYCGNAELRANHTDICKGIHNDDSARALQAFGWIF